MRRRQDVLEKNVNASEHRGAHSKHALPRAPNVDVDDS
jgi:hypothetical protein